MRVPDEAWPVPAIDYTYCTGCGLCQQHCPTQAVEVHEQHAVIVRPELCTFCEICETLCPTGAIERPFRIVFAAATSHNGQ